ncbi:alpha/beta fold hydrolase [Streptomyces pinistramenti]|uniref:alpha/beta fold hydrolase n=1 Tax=Streptomyces pinistramenti TaxID=2884812 RepID=UPI001D07D021|nr:alpha/beta hydrolase [Streptomyces pinistramenti]MCB5910067.1 alpha/beta hydrolase [Streptomyces pinistramenti]
MSTTSQRVLPLRPGLELTVREWGEGPCVLLLHGGPGPDSLTPLAEHLALRHRVIVPVHPGWDDTRRPSELDSVPRLADVYLDLLDHLEADPVALVGTSFGGWIAAETILRDQGRRIGRLVLMDAIGPAMPGHRIAVPGQGPGTQSAPAGPVPPSAATGQSGPPRGPSPASLAALRAYAGPDMQDPGLLERIKAVTRPVLVVWGENDQVVSSAYGRTYADAFHDARFALIPGAGHLPIREEPDATFAAIDGFLDADGPAPV